MVGGSGTAAKEGGIFYGWVVVSAAFVVMFLGFGVAYSFGAFFKPLQTEFGATRAEISFVFSLSAIIYFTVGAFSGPLADRFGPKWVCAFGMVLIGGGLIVASGATTLWQVTLTYGLAVGLGVGFSYVPAIAAVQPWFTRRRGIASGIAVSGIGVGTFAMPVVSAWLIGVWDWRTAYLVMAVMAVLFGVAASLLIENMPARKGREPERDSTGAGPAAAATPIADVGLREAIFSRPFILYYVTSLFTSFGLFIPLVHLPNYATDQGLSRDTGVLLIAVFGIGSIVGRFALGGFADRVGRRNALAGAFFVMMLMMLWWYVSTDAWALALYALIFGSCYGGYVALSPALMMDFYGARSVSGIIGFLYTGAGLGVFIGPVLAGYAYDLTQSYDLPILGAAAGNLVAMALMLGVPQPERWRAARAG